MVKKIIVNIVILLGIFFNITNASANCPCWKNLYLCPCTKGISKLIFIKDNIYAFSTNEGLLKSDDQGETWTAMRTGLSWEDLRMVGLVGDEANHFILATTEPAFYEWQPMERQWKEIAAKGIPSYGHMTSFIQDSRGTLYASFDDNDVVSKDSVGGVYQSTNHGADWTNLKLNNALMNNNAHLDSISKTKIILDDKNNLYVKGKAIYRENNNFHKKYFVYQLPFGRYRWVDTGYIASDIFITHNGLLGILFNDGRVSINDLQLSSDGKLIEKRHWIFSPPDDNVRSIITTDQNNMYMVTKSNLYQLNDINDVQSQWTIIDNGKVNIPDVIYLAVHHHHLYATGERMGQSQSSVDVFELG